MFNSNKNLAATNSKQSMCIKHERCFFYRISKLKVKNVCYTELIMVIRNILIDFYGQSFQLIMIS